MQASTFSDSAISSAKQLLIDDALGAKVDQPQFVPPMGRPHLHPELELNLVLSGEATYFLQGRRYDLAPGSLVWLFPGQAHVLLGNSSRFRYILGIYRREFVAEFAPPLARETLLSLDPPGDYCRALPHEAWTALEKTLTEPLQASDPFTHRLGLGFGLARAWEAFSAAEALSPQPKIHESIQQTLNLLRTADSEATLVQIAREVGLAPSYLSTLFREQIGQSLVDYRTQIRLERTVEIHRTGNVSWLQAALEGGFGSYTQFYRSYKKRFGVPPSDRIQRFEA